MRSSSLGWLMVILLAACQENTIDLERVGSVEGTVVNNDFEPLANAQITTVPATSVVLSDSAGVFTIEGIVEGEYTLFAEQTNYERASLKVTVVGDQVSQAAFVLDLVPPTFSQLSGTVVDAATNRVLSNVSVTTNPPTSALLTNELGRVSVDSIPEGIYTIIAKKAGYQTDSVTISLSAGRVNPFVLPISPSEGS
ncbi:MAG: carboxypeptidase regulatory-like domain-containing protein [Bacteroidota bacterium]